MSGARGAGTGRQGVKKARSCDSQGFGAQNQVQSHAHPADAILATMSERDFQRHVVGTLRDCSYAVWVVPDMRKTRAGLPDIVALGPVAGPRSGPLRLLFWELKSQRGRVRPEQRNVIEYLQMVAGDIDARIVRPADWVALRDEIGLVPFSQALAQALDAHRPPSTEQED